MLCAGGMWLCLLSLLDPYQFYLMLALAWQCLALVCFLRNINLALLCSFEVLGDLKSLVGFVGLFMALQPKIIACGNSVASFAMAVRFLTGPAVMAVASIVVGLRGVLLHIAIVQVKEGVVSCRVS